MAQLRPFACFVALLFAVVATRSTMAEPFPTSADEGQLIAVLQSGEPADKALACKKLAIFGGKTAVPELAKLLADKDLASWARIALEAIPDESAAIALRDASENLDGLLLVGTINSLGVRRDVGATPLLLKRLNHQDAEVASAAAVALGRIGNADAIEALRRALAKSPAEVKPAIAEGCILAAEQLLAAGNEKAAAEIYDEVRKAEVPKQKKLEATRGVILARGTEGIPLLIEQLQSDDRRFLMIGLTVARELPGQAVADALAAELEKASDDRAALLLYALADRQDAVATPAIIKLANSGDPQVRIAAIALLARSTDLASLPPLLESAAHENAEVAQAAKVALAGLPGENVNAEVIRRLNDADGKPLAVLIEMVGARRIPATAPLVKALGHADASIRHAALAALGETIGADELNVLISQVNHPRQETDLPVARRALRAASVRMPDREACATELAAALKDGNAETKVKIIEILGEMGGPKALATIASAMKTGDEPLQDAGSRMLGKWMTIDAAPVLLDLAKTASDDKYQVRSLRGYIRIARQFIMPPEQRAEMCRQALETARRADEQKLVLEVLARYPNAKSFKLAVFAASLPGLKNDAASAASVIANKLTGSPEKAAEMLKEAGLEVPQFEILKATYGAGSSQLDVTELLRKQLGQSLSTRLPASNYNEKFGGDPAPGVPKQLIIEYRIDGNSKTAKFNENDPIALTAP